ncbi:hypothetical protein ASG74_04035 [Knoellia sp. Soil729]|nr:hypothetical protein ASG74_04035 [Knoellia sp. Soil729]
MLRRVAAAGCGAVAALLLVGVMRPPPVPTTAVLVAARELEAGALLEATDVRVAHLSGGEGAVGSVGTLQDTHEVVGRRLTSPVQQGEIVTTGRLVPRSPADRLPAGSVAAHLLVADERSLDLVSAGRRVTLFADTGGPAVARDVLVLAVDTPETRGVTGSLPGTGSPPRGIVVALGTPGLEAVFAGQRPDGGPPRVVAVVTG